MFTGVPPEDCEADATSSDDCCVAGRVCGFDPEMGLKAACQNGVCAAFLIVDSVAPNDTEAASVIAVDDRVIWSTGVNGRILAANNEDWGSQVDELSTSGTDEPQFLLAAEGFVFWTSRNTPDIRRVDLLGANETLVGSVGGANGNSYGRMTYFEGNIYFAHDQPEASGGGIYRVSAMAENEAAALIAPAESPEGIAVDGNFVYWTEPEGGRVMKQALDDGGATPEVVAANQDSPSHLTHDANRLYWVTTNTVEGMEKNDTAPTSLVTHTGGSIGGRGLAVDDAFVYWIEYDGGAMGTVWKSNKYDADGNEYVLIEPFADLPTSIGQACEHIYVSLDGGQILRVTK